MGLLRRLALGPLKGRTETPGDVPYARDVVVLRLWRELWSSYFENSKSLIDTNNL